MTRCTSTSFHDHFTYDVFLNFRGKDTRHGFTGNLYYALTKKGVRTFFDDEEIKKGDEITPRLLKAIQESRMAITIFSKNYASSTFCLDELVHIHQCVKQNGRLVWPIFYDLQPCEVRYQTGNYGQALAKHKLKLRADEKKMQDWKLALYDVANISGIPLDPGHDYEYQFIERIVKEISSIISRVPLHVAEYPVGLDSQLEEINTLLQLGSKDEVIMVGICGIGGMGKTTIARAVYNSIADNFDGLCFLDNIKEKSRKFGLEKMQERMLSKILGADTKIDDVHEGVQIIKERFEQKKILLILDNVDKREQLQKLGRRDLFGSGSRIIITTRDKHLLLSHGVNVKSIYDMKALNYEQSRQLLEWNAFRNIQPDESYDEVLNRVLRYTQGHPLALEVIGSNLFGKTISEWESALDMYKRIPNGDIQQRLKVSYDGLEQDEKEVFLDIACFFNGGELESVKDMVKHIHGFDPNYHIGVLINKCLIKILKPGAIHHMPDYIIMHDLICEMGREIVRQESPKQPGKRSRLWFNQNIIHVLENNTGTNEVNIIISENLWKSIDVYWDGDAFKNMKSLKILILRNLKFSKGPRYLPNSLKVLKWRGYPSSSLPYDFCPKKLVVLELRDGCFSSMETIKKMENLSVLTLEKVGHIKQIPNLSGLSNLKELTVDSCDNLIGVDDSVGYLRNLEIFSVSVCCQLDTFPRRIKLAFLKEFSLIYCPRLKNFPEINGEMKLRSLDLVGTGIKKLPLSICKLTQLRGLCIQNEGGGVIELPSGLFHLPELNEIFVEDAKLVMDIACPNKIDHFSLWDCNISNENLQIYLKALINVEYLDLSRCNFTILPACIKECRSLWRLVLDYCEHLREVEEIPPNIKELTAIDCISLSTKSRNLLLSEELIGAAVIRPRHDEHFEFLILGESIPEWFDHRRKGASICFWFRSSFPNLCLGVLFHEAFSFTYTASRLYINFKSVYVHLLSELTNQRNGDHIVLYDLKGDYLDDDIMEPILQEGVWNHAEVCLKYNDIKEIGLYVIKQHCNMEDIRFTPPPKRMDSMSGDQVYETPESPYDKDDNVKWCYACSDDGNNLLTHSSENSSEWCEGNSYHSRDIYAGLNEGSNHLNVVDTVESIGNYPFLSDFRDNNALPIYQGVNDQTASTSNDVGTNYPRPDSLPFLFQIPARFGVDDFYLLSSEEGTECFDPSMQEKVPMLSNKRLLMEDGNFASSSMPFSCTKRRRHSSINEDENDVNTTEINSANAIETIGNNSSMSLSAWLWATTLDGNDATKDSLPMLPWTEQTHSTFNNQGHNSEENNWLSCWETPFDDRSISHQEFLPTQYLTSINLEEIPETSDRRKAKGKEIVIYNDNINKK